MAGSESRKGTHYVTTVCLQAARARPSPGLTQIGQGHDCFDAPGLFVSDSSVLKALVTQLTLNVVACLSWRVNLIYQAETNFFCLSAVHVCFPCQYDFSGLDNKQSYQSYLIK